MTQSVLELLRSYLAQYGYWAVGITLLLENAGIPLPGETVLLLASFLAYSQHEFHLGWVMAVATVAAVTGDNLGFWIGSRGGRPFLDRYRSTFRIPEKVIERGETLFARYGAMTQAVAEHLGPDAVARSHQAAHQTIGALLDRGRADGSFRTDLPAGWLVTAAVAVIHACAAEVRSGRIDERDAPGILSELQSAIEKGLARPPLPITAVPQAA